MGISITKKQCEEILNMFGNGEDAYITELRVEPGRKTGLNGLFVYYAEYLDEGSNFYENDIENNE